jgi:succinate-semialdehyde dehydrogenase/glutarate-semialdehyde dehydrogenase
MYDTKLFIDGAWREGSGGASFAVENPAMAEVVAHAAQASPQDTMEAIECAARAFKIWRNTDPWARSAALRTTAVRLRNEAATIARLITIETGKPLRQAAGEVNTAADYFDWFADEARRVRGETMEARSAGVRLQFEREPIGVVAVLTSWNFPVNLPARKIAAALAAGCTVICRPSEEAPASTAALFRCMEDTGMPAGTVNLLLGYHDPIVPTLMRDTRVRKISFTGSTAVGQSLMRDAAQTVKKLSLELGGHASAIVFADADIDKFARDLVDFKFRNAGQICISPSRFYVHDSVYDRFIERAREAMELLRLGNGMEDQTDVGPLINRRRLDAVSASVQSALQSGATLLAGGKRPAALDRGYFFEPTLLGEVPDTAPVMQVEPFGPLIPASRFSDFDEVMERANSLEFGLANYVFTQSLSTAHAAIAGLQSGMVAVNNTAVATVEGPFGGVKQSGFGSEGGSLGIHEYQVTKFAKIALAGAR